MAQKLALLKSFATGQGAGASTYTDYAPDHDANYAAIEATVNTIVDEINAFAGQNATLVLDLIRSPSSPSVQVGTMDATSFAPVAFLSGNTQIQIPPGVALTGVGKVESTTTATLPGSGVSGIRYVSLDTNGNVSLQTSSSQGVMDLYSVTWTGAAFDTGTLAQLQVVLPGGHDLQNLKTQEDYGQTSDASIPPFTYNRIADRISDIVRLLGGQLTSADATQAALGPIAFGGSAATPGLILGDGSTHAVTSGLFSSPASNQFGLSVLATQLVLFAENATNEPQARFRNGTSLADPPIAFSDRDNGLGYVSGDQWRAIAGSTEALRFFANGIGVRDGSAAAPGAAFETDRDTGLFRVGADAWGLAAGGTSSLEGNAQQQVNAPSQGRVSATVASTSIGNSGTLANVSFDTEVTDVGGWFAPTSADFTVPTGHGGRVVISGEVEFPVGNGDGERHVAIEVNGASVRQIRLPPVGSGVTILAVAISVPVSDAQVIRLQAAHTDTSGALNVRAELDVQRVP